MKDLGVNPLSPPCGNSTPPAEGHSFPLGTKSCCSRLFCPSLDFQISILVMNREEQVIYCNGNTVSHISISFSFGHESTTNHPPHPELSLCVRHYYLKKIELLLLSLSSCSRAIYELVCLSLNCHWHSEDLSNIVSASGLSSCVWDMKETLSLSWKPRVSQGFLQLQSYVHQHGKVTAFDPVILLACVCEVPEGRFFCHLSSQFSYKHYTLFHE